MQGFKVSPSNTYNTSANTADLPKSYADAQARFHAWEYKRGRRSAQCKLAHNTFLEWDNTRDGTVFYVRFHNTRIVTFYSDGRVVLDSSGWQTMMSRDRWNRCGVRVSMSNGIASVSHGGRDVCYRDGLTLHPDGGATFADGKRAPDASGARAKRRRVLAKARRQFKKGGIMAVTPDPFYWPLRSGGWANGGNAPEAFTD